MILRSHGFYGFGGEDICNTWYLVVHRCLWAEATLSCVADRLLPLIRSIACRIICRAPWAKLQKYCCKYKHGYFACTSYAFTSSTTGGRMYIEEPIRRYLGEEINIFDVSISIQKRKSGREKKKRDLDLLKIGKIASQNRQFDPTLLVHGWIQQ